MNMIKSKERVKLLGEVYTPLKLVNEMLDQVEPILLKTTILEPSCGNGNFIMAILERKLKLCQNDNDILIALSTIYGIDICPENVQDTKDRIIELIGDNPKFIHIIDNNIIVGDFLKLDNLYITEYDDQLNEKRVKIDQSQPSLF